MATGDIGASRGRRVVLAGRAKDMILRGAENIYPGLYEPALHIPGVDLAVIVGVPAGDGDERVVAVVQPCAGADRDAVRAALRSPLDRMGAARPDAVLLAEVPAGRALPKAGPRGGVPPGCGTGARPGRRMRARTRDRLVYLGSHPLLFALLAATRHRPVRRLGGTVLVHDRDAFVIALTRIPLDRTAEGTTGGAAGRLTGAGMLFDQQGDAHRRTRRATADMLSAAGVARLRPLWTDLLRRRLEPLAAGGEVDLVPLAAEIAGATAADLLELPLDGRTLATAARAAGATAARAHLPGVGPRRRAHRGAELAATRLTALVAAGRRPGGRLGHDAGGGRDQHDGRRAAAGGGLVRRRRPVAVRREPRPALADEVLRVIAPTPLLPRAAAAPAAGRRTGRAARCVPAIASCSSHGTPSPRTPATPTRSTPRPRPSRSWCSGSARTPAPAPASPAPSSPTS